MSKAAYESTPSLRLTTRFKWNILDSNVNETEELGILNSDDFTLNESDMKVALQLVCQPNSGIILLQLILKQAGSVEIQDICCNFWIVKSNGKKILLHAKNKKISEDQPIFEVESHYTNDNDTLSGILFNSRATAIVCEVNHTKKEPKVLPLAFRENLWNAYKNRLQGECTIQVEGKEFKISKTILTAQSEVFERMFSIDQTEENQTGIVKIQDISANVMEAAIQFLHLGAVENLDKIAEKLFVFADKYAIIDLKVQCANSIGASLDKENFFDRLVLAFKYNNDELKKRILDFLSKSNDGIFMSLLASDKWNQFVTDNKELAKEILEAVGKKLNIVH